MKKVKHSTDLQISLGYFGFSNETIYINLENDDLDSIQLSQIDGYDEDADPIEAINDAISSLKVMITRLESLKQSKDPMIDTKQDVANNINYYKE